MAPTTFFIDRPDLEEIVGDEPLALEGLVPEQRMRQHEEGHLDELGQLLLHHDVDHPAETKSELDFNA